MRHLPNIFPTIIASLIRCLLEPFIHRRVLLLSTWLHRIMEAWSWESSIIPALHLLFFPPLECVPHCYSFLECAEKSAWLACHFLIVEWQLAICFCALQSTKLILIFMLQIGVWLGPTVRSQCKTGPGWNWMALSSAILFWHFSNCNFLRLQHPMGLLVLTLPQEHQIKYNSY
jgi:hypothetical protein